MTYQQAVLVVDGLVECGMVHRSATYYLKQLLNRHGTYTALMQIEDMQRWNAATNAPQRPHPRHNPEGYEVWIKREGTI